MAENTMPRFSQSSTTNNEHKKKGCAKRIVGDVKTGEANTQYKCCITSDQGHSPQALNLENTPQEKLVLVIEEFLQETIPIYKDRLPQKMEDFDTTQYAYIGTKRRTAIVVTRLSGQRVYFYHLLNNKDRLWTAGLLAKDIYDQIFFYSEFAR
ncbi:unnamed protein product [Fusarium venenatum]|uniref:Uncharacterized protein n=1 Tax=Fusarium venenatum TaxID=56646 RepID=A0A2L2TJP2_9HYPO|nr:uncharacterized protein FVRRES_01169 [Fusarium venenatum]CEI64657.1 unnamed protein product [Fusarium venenatum]